MGFGDTEVMGLGVFGTVNCLLVEGEVRAVEAEEAVDFVLGMEEVAEEGRGQNVREP